MKRHLTILWTLVPLLISTAASAVDETFPGRNAFPDVLIYENSRLFNDFKDVVLVDTRSQKEYETLRIKGAVNIPVLSKEFADRIKLLRASTNKPIVFYTSRKTCNKSYLAGRKANQLNIEDTYAYDAGVYDWAKTHPNHVILLGKRSDDVPADIIPPKKIQVSFVGP